MGKLNDKVKAAKKKIADKAKKVKKVAKKVGAFALLCALPFAVGCATSEPASRATTARYGDIIIRLDDKAHNNTIRLTIGDGALASADSSGSTETMTANPTNDVKPKTEVSIPSGGVTGAVSEAAKAVGECVGGACSE